MVEEKEVPTWGEGLADAAVEAVAPDQRRLHLLRLRLDACAVRVGHLVPGDQVIRWPGKREGGDQSTR